MLLTSFLGPVLVKPEGLTYPVRISVQTDILDRTGKPEDRASRVR